MKKYIPAEFEQKWVDTWEKNSLFQGTYDQEGVTPENKMYLLYAFAYPSGEGLHVGHVEPVTALDILARYYRSIGKKVFFPVGWDAFGLPAENYAIKTGVPPAETTKKAIANFSRQVKRLGISYDWETEVATSHPGYYKWTQWLFLQFYKKGLAYKKSAPVNWCPSCQTVLANEQVVDGKCERCGTTVVQKEMEQWFFKITEYKDELISGLNEVDWPHATKQQQLNWINKKEGVIINHKVIDTDIVLNSFSAFPAWLFADTFLVIAPEHPQVKDLVSGTAQEKEVADFIEEFKKISPDERNANKFEKKGVFTGRYVTDPFSGNKMPVWLANFALMDFGTGIIRCSAHDPRDYEFAQKYNIPLKEVVERVDSKEPVNAHDNEGILKDSGPFSGKKINKELIQEMLDWIEKQKIGKRETTYKLRDWLISRQRYWGAPIPVVYDPEGNEHPVKDEHLPWLLPTDVDFRPTGESPLRRSKEFKERTEKLYGKGWTPEYDTMDTFVDSSWYYLRYTDPRNEEEYAKKDHLSKWMPVDFYMIGPEHIVLHLLYSRFFTKFLRDEGHFKTSEPFSYMRHQGMILGPDNRKMSKSKGNVINPDTVIQEYGADTLRMYEMFMGPIDADKPWSQTSVHGVYRFLQRIWKKMEKDYGPEAKEVQENKEIVIALNKTIDKVGRDIESLKYNTAIAAMMEFINTWEPVPEPSLSKENAQKLLKILSVFAPFISEQIYSDVFGKTSSIHLEKWPEVEQKALAESSVTIPVQVNGKMRATIVVPMNSLQEEVVKKAVEHEKVKSYVEGKEYKVIFVPNKILNLIVR